MQDDRVKIVEPDADEVDSYFRQERPEMLPFVDDNVKTVLDVGCGAGEFAASLKVERPGLVVWGIEPVGAAASLAGARLDRVIAQSFKPGMDDLAGKQFDCILFNDVLEHMADPDNILRECREYLAPGGCVVASIPNILYFYEITRILVKEDWEYRDHGILDKTHLRFFTRKSIVRMFIAAGYEIDEIRGIGGFAGKKYKIANFLTLGRLHDWRYVQFGVRARLSR